MRRLDSQWRLSMERCLFVVILVSGLVSATWYSIDEVTALRKALLDGSCSELGCPGEAVYPGRGRPAEGALLAGVVGMGE